MSFSEMTETQKRIIGAAVAVVALVAILAVALVPLITTPKEENGPVTASGGYTLCESGKLTVTSEFDNSPFEMKSAVSYTGFSIDLMKEIASRLGLEAEFGNSRTRLDIPWMLERYGADVAISSFAAGELDSSEVTYTDPYFTYQLVAVQIDTTSYEYSHRSEGDAKSFATVADIKDCAVAVKSGSYAEEWAKKNLTTCTIVSRDTEELAMAEVKGGSADVAILVKEKADYCLASTYTYLSEIGTIEGTGDYVMAVEAQNDALKEAINQALANMKADGAYQELYDKHFKGSK